MTVTEAQQTEVEIPSKQLPPEIEETASLEFTDDKHYMRRNYTKGDSKK